MELVRAQLRRATEKYEYMISKLSSCDSSQPMDVEISQNLGRSLSGLHKQHSCPAHLLDVESITRSNGWTSCSTNQTSPHLERAQSIPVSTEVSLTNLVDPEDQENSAKKSLTEVKKPEPIRIPEDFLCPISLELMRDPVIVATGQVWFNSLIKYKALLVNVKVLPYF